MQSNANLRVHAPTTPKVGLKRRLSGSSEVGPPVTPMSLGLTAKSKLHQAVFDGDLAAVQRLAAEMPKQLNATNTTDGITPLMTASLLSNAAKAVEISEALLAAGATLELQDKQGNTALHWACKEGRQSMTKLLAARTAGFEVCNNDGDTAVSAVWRRRVARGVRV